MLIPLVTIGLLSGYSEENVNLTFGFGDMEISLMEAGPIILFILILLMAAILLATYRISKHTYRMSK